MNASPTPPPSPAPSLVTARTALAHASMPRTVGIAGQGSPGSQGAQHRSTGVGALDAVTNGGVCDGELVMVAGDRPAPRFQLCLQWARQLALDGLPAVYLAPGRDHDELVTELVRLEVGDLLDRAGADVEERSELLGRIDDVLDGALVLTEVLASHRLLERAELALSRYGDRLLLAAGDDGRRLTSVSALSEWLDGPGRSVHTVFIDPIERMTTDEPLRQRPMVMPGDVAMVGLPWDHLAAQLRLLTVDRARTIVALATSDAVGLTFAYAGVVRSLACEADIVVELVSDPPQTRIRAWSNRDRRVGPPRMLRAPSVRALASVDKDVMDGGDGRPR